MLDNFGDRHRMEIWASSQDVEKECGREIEEYIKRHTVFKVVVPVVVTVSTKDNKIRGVICSSRITAPEVMPVKLSVDTSTPRAPCTLTLRFALPSMGMTKPAVHRAVGAALALVPSAANYGAAWFAPHRSIP